jgi:LytS/YehU family sensor histidine kinase
LTPLTEILYDNIPAGAYSLDVRVCDQSGYCSEVNNALSFSRRKAVWLEWWFIAGIGAITILCVWWLLNLRQRRKYKTADLDKRRLEAELNALTLEQKALQLQMNPHFIFNALQTVRSQIRDDNLDTARDNLTHFSKLMRSMLDASRAERISLEDELAFLQSYVEVEQMTKSVPIRYTVSLAAEIEPFAVELPPMLIQPVVENAIKYGGDEQEIIIYLSISLVNDVLVVIVKDQGRGPIVQPEHKSASLEIIRNRLRHLGKGGGLEVEHKSGEGMCVTMRIPC